MTSSPNALAGVAVVGASGISGPRFDGGFIHGVRGTSVQQFRRKHRSLRAALKA